MSSYRSRPVLARFEYRAYISRYFNTGGSLSKRSLFSPLCTSWMLLWRLSLTKVTYGGTAAKLRSLFHGWKFLKLFKRRTVNQAVPEIPLSVGSKPELLLSLPNFRILPHTLTHLSCHVRVYYNVHDRGAEGFAL